MKRTCENCRFFETVPDFVEDKFGKCNFLLNGKFPYWLMDEFRGKYNLLKLVPNDAKYCKSWKRKNISYDLN